MKHILAIMNKEFKRFFTDRRLIFSLIAPGIAIFIIYSIIGNTSVSYGNINQNKAPSQEFKIVYNRDIPKLDQNELFLFKGKYAETKVDMQDKSDNEIFAALENNEIHLYLKFDENFDENFSNGQSANVQIFYNSGNNDSIALYNNYSKALEAIVLNNRLAINKDINTKYDYVVPKNLMKEIMMSIIPLLLSVILFASSFMVCLESIVGEKERGTIASLLSTPTKRRDIAFGKIFALAVISLVSTFFTTFGLIMSLPKLLGGNLSLDIFNFTTYLLLIIVLIIATLIYITTISLLSAFAKSTKEANTYGSLFMIIIMILGFSSMLVSDTSFISYLIPIMNINLLINNVLNSNLTILNFLLGIGSSIGYIFLGVFLLTKMFNSEKIMFNINK